MTLAVSCMPRVRFIDIWSSPIPRLPRLPVPLDGRFRACERCSTSKGKRQTPRKITLSRSERPLQLALVDLPGPKLTQFVGGALHSAHQGWLLPFRLDVFPKQQVRRWGNIPGIPRRHLRQHETIGCRGRLI